MRTGRMDSFAAPLLRRSLAIVSLLGVCGAALAQPAGPSRRAPTPDDEIVLRGREGSEIEAIAVSPDGARVATLEYDMGENGLEASVRLWDVAARRVRFAASLDWVNLPTCGEGWHFLREHVNSFWQVAFSPDGQFLTAGAFGCRAVKVWEVATGKECLNLALDDATRRNRIEWHRRSWFAPDGRTLTIHLDRADWTGEGDAEVWTYATDLVFVDTATWRVRSRRTIPTDDVYASGLRPDGTALIVASCEGPAITTWDLTVEPPRLAARRELDPPDGPDECEPEDLPKFSPDGSAVAESGGRILRWPGGRPRAVRLEGGRGLSSLEFSPDGRLVYGARSYEPWRLAGKVPDAVGDRLRGFIDIDEYRAIGEVLVWDAATGRRLASRVRLDWSPWVIATFPDGRRVAIADGSNIILWRIDGR
jgi:WD domain, G-beta repeat